jgi:transketolase
VRYAFAEALNSLAAEDERIVLLTGDLGFTVLESFAERFPDRFYNVGVAEQNMVGLATGLADAGFVPFVYSIATFLSMRPYEFIRNGPLLHQLPTRLVGAGGGFDYGHNGVTHYALEDVALMRAQPAMTVVVPADPRQVFGAIEATSEWGGPIYFRLGKQDGSVPGLDGRFALGRAELIGSGTDVAIIALGPAANEAVEAASLLEAQAVSSTVAVVSSFNPSPDAAIVELLDSVPVAVTVEAHYLTGGLGSYVCEVVAESGVRCRVVRSAVRRIPRGEAGARRFLHGLHGISAEAVARVAAEELELVPRSR